MANPNPGALAAKHALRQRLLAARRAVLPDELRQRSRQLLAQIEAHPLWRDAEALAAFVGVRGEVETTPLLRASVAAGKRVWLPTLTGPGTMRFWPCDDLDALERGPMGLLEPAQVGPGLPAPGPEHGVTLMLVPGLGFGRDGARLGYGRGYYDRALATRDPGSGPTLCGVCLARFVDPAGGPIPILAHDYRVHALATEDGVEVLDGS